MRGAQRCETAILVAIAPVERGAADVAVGFTDEYAGVFEELAK